MAVSKMERLLNLMAVLLEAPRPVTAAQLQRRVPGYPDGEASFRRAFERDKDDLREMGVPLRLEPVPLSDPPAEGYRIHTKDYYLRDPGLTDDELEALNLAASAVRLDGGPGVEALWKLGGAVGGTDGHVPEVAMLPSDANVVASFTGVMERRVLRFRYNELDREVNPYRLDFARGRWYLNGFDHVRLDERWYRLDRMDGPVVVGDRRDAFARPVEAVPGLQLDPWQLGDEEPVVAHVLFDADQAPLVRRSVGADRITDERPDGSVVMAFDVVNRDGFRSFVLAFLDHAVVLDPEDLRTDVVGWLERLAAG